MIILTLFAIANLISYSTQTFVDLGHEVSHDAPLYPLPGYLLNKFTLTAVANETTSKGFWIAYNKFCTVEHVSTHIDAPYHFYQAGWTVDQIPLEHLIAPGVVIDVTAKAAENATYLISAVDVDEWVDANGVFPNNSIILGRTGWSKKWKDPLAYLGHLTEAAKLIFPGFGADSIRRILNFKKTHNIHVVGFGIDTISLDHGPSQEYESHVIVQGENLYIIENMNNLEALPLTGSRIFVMPMKITDGTGAPTRVIAELSSTEEVTKSVLPSTETSSSVSAAINEASSVETSSNVPTDTDAKPTVSSTSETPPDETPIQN